MMEGFFNKRETASDSRPDGKVYSCISCGLFKNVQSPKMKPKGGFKKGILNIAVMPSKQDDMRDSPFHGKSFSQLRTIYSDMGIDLDEDCMNMYCIHCNCDSPTTHNVDCCRETTIKLIRKLKPKVIVLFGIEPVYSLIGHRWKKDFGTIDKWRGWQIPDQEFETFICPTFDLNFALNHKNTAYELWLKKDLEKAGDKIHTKFPKHPEPIITYLNDDLLVLDTINSGTVVIDYETTGIKSYREGHKIICASVAVNVDRVYVFPIPNSRSKLKPFTDLLKRESVEKMAHNMKYEDTWSKVILKTDINNWTYDTMLGTHLFDNRPNITGLKFQTYVQLGIVDYDDEISFYIGTSKEAKNSNSFNNVDKLLERSNGLESLMKYCALDSIYTYRLYYHVHSKIIMATSNRGQTQAYGLLHNGSLALAKAERQGLRIDVEYCKRQMQERLTKKIQLLEDKIYNSNFYKDWTRAVDKVNISSDTQLRHYLYDVKKLKPLKFTENNSPSTDEEALRMLKIPELDWILERSKYLNARDTFLAGIMKEQTDGVLHPFFNLNLVQTYRSSSSNPNFQNMPKRDKEIMNIVRKSIFPRYGHQLLELDYSGIEVAIAATYHKDPTMLKYLTDPSTNMHGDMAKQIFKLDSYNSDSKDHDYMRSCVKNSFVFPQFYGDYYKNCATNICGQWMDLPQGKWKKTDGYTFQDGTTIGAWLINKGLDNYYTFENHIQVIEKDFWTKRFPVYATWKDNHHKRYLRNGYVKLHSGFTCSGVMSRNQCINWPVQGAAFHCLLWTLIETTKELERRNFKTKIVGQIHDSIVLDVYPDELSEIYLMVYEIGTVRIKEVFTWINVPLKIDAELSPVDRSWAEKEKWKYDFKKV